MGTEPEERDWLNNCERYSEMEAVQALSIWVNIPLGPEADFIFSDRTIEATSPLEQEMVDKPCQ